MGFPNVIYGDFGDEKIAQSTKIGNLPLGQLMILPDGRKFRHAKSHTAQAMTAGYLYQFAGGTATAGTGYQTALTCSASVGDTSVVVTTPSGTAVAVDYFADGYLVVASSSGTGVGLSYKVKTNNSAAAAATCTVALYPEDPIQVAIGGTTALVGLVPNQFNETTLMTGDTTLAGPIAGVPPVAVSAGFYHWLARGGPAACYVAASVLVAGDAVIASTGEVGAFSDILASGTASAKVMYTLGQTLSVSVTGGFSMIDLDLD